jgi:hypothetical protein
MSLPSLLQYSLDNEEYVVYEKNALRGDGTADFGVHKSVVT